MDYLKRTRLYMFVVGAVNPKDGTLGNIDIKDHNYTLNLDMKW